MCYYSRQWKAWISKVQWNQAFAALLVYTECGFVPILYQPEADFWKVLYRYMQDGLISVLLFCCYIVRRGDSSKSSKVGLCRPYCCVLHGRATKSHKAGDECWNKKGLYYFNLLCASINSSTAIFGIFQILPIRKALILFSFSNLYAVLRPMERMLQSSSKVINSAGSLFMVFFSLSAFFILFLCLV